MLDGCRTKELALLMGRMACRETDYISDIKRRPREEMAILLQQPGQPRPNIGHVIRVLDAVIAPFASLEVDLLLFSRINCLSRYEPR